MKSKKSKTAETPATETPSHPTSLPQWLLEETDTLQEMIEWWKTRESVVIETADRRPMFAGQTKNTGIRVNTVILERAVNKAKKERLKTGGNLSQLVEWLLWVYIGTPEDVIER